MSMPWMVNSKTTLDLNRDAKLATDTLMVVPTQYVEAAKRMLSRYEVGMQLGREYQFNLNPLYGFSRNYINDVFPEKVLLNARIPCAVVKPCRVRGSSGRAVNAYKLDCYYWEIDENYTKHFEMHLVDDISPDQLFNTLDIKLKLWNWNVITEYSLKLKTLSLLQGNSNGLPKTHEQGQNWSFD
jgi:hypothetical protein